VAVGDEGAHPELLGERERVTIMAVSMFRGTAVGGDLAEEAEGPRLATALTALAPAWAIGVGGFAERRIRAVLAAGLVTGATAGAMRVGQILHPSPASPAANRAWVEKMEGQLAALGVPLP